MENKRGTQDYWFRRTLAEALVLRGKRKTYKEKLHRLEWASKEDITQYQEACLARVLTDAKCHIPFYRDRVQGEGLSAFPILTRTDIKNHREELIVSERMNKETMCDTTSGTTSEPISFLLDRGHRDRGAVQKSFFSEWAGLRLGDPMIKLWGVFSSSSWKVRMRTDWSHWIRNMKLMNSVNLRAERIEAFAEEIQKIQPKLILSYSNVMYEFALYLEREKIEMNYMGAIMTSASSLTPAKRDAIQRVFQCPIFDRYGSREMVDMACTCEKNEGLHVSPFMNYLEVLDEAGNPCVPGQTGRIVVTQLFNPVMPLIRYELGDYGTWAEKPCSCGRNWPLLKQIDGRSISMFRHRDGGRIASYYFIVHVNRVIGKNRILRQQIIQEDYNPFTIKLVMADPAHWENREANRLQLTRLIGELIGEAVEIVFEVVDEIPLQASGKYMQAFCKIK